MIGKIEILSIQQNINKELYLIFNGRAVPRPLSFYPSTISGSFMQVVFNKLVGSFCGTCQIAAHLFPLNMKVRIKTKPADL